MADLGIDDPADFIAASDAGWADESAFAWAVCIPTTGELVALVTVSVDDDSAGRLGGAARTGYDSALDAATAPVRRFAEGMLGLNVTEHRGPHHWPGRRTPPR